jgi:hypothetical protein
METQRIWTKTADKVAHVLMLRDHEVHCLKVTGNMLTLNRNLKGVLEALERGQAPSNAGAKSVVSLDTRKIGKAQVSPGNGSLTLFEEGDGATKLSFSTGDGNADEILRTILAKSERTFQPTQEEIGVVEALIPPAVIGALGGLFWAGVYQSAGKMAAGEVVEAHGRRRGMQQLLIWVAELLGTGGTIAAGAVLLALIVGWAAKRVVKRPERTVWLPAPA